MGKDSQHIDEAYSLMLPGEKCKAMRYLIVYMMNPAIEKILDARLKFAVGEILDPQVAKELETIELEY